MTPSPSQPSTQPLKSTPIPATSDASGAPDRSGPASGAFWEEGLRGLDRAGTDTTGTELAAVERCRELIADDLLPPLIELIADASHRRSELVSIAATAFAAHLIEWQGTARYQRLLQRVQAGRPDAFQRTYRRPLALVEREWRRKLGATDANGGPSSWAVVWALVPFARPYWRSALAIVAFTLVGIAFSLSLPLTFRFLIDNILSRRPLVDAVPFVGPAGHVIESSAEQVQVLLGLMGGLCLLYVLNAIARLRLVRTVNRLGEALVYDVRRKMLDRVADLPAGRYANMTVADIEQRLVYDASALQQVVAAGLVPLLAGGLAIIFSATALISLQPTLSLVVLIGLPIMAVMARLRRRGIRLAARERSRRLSGIAGSVGELASAQMLVKIYLASGHLLERLNLRLELHRQLNVTFAHESSLLGQVGMLVMYLTQVAVLLVGGYLVIVSDGQALAPGGLAAFYVLLNQLFVPVQQIASGRQTLVSSSANIERVSEVLAWPIETDKTDAEDVGPLREAICFEQVTFGYDPERPVLRDLSLTIPAGSTVALVGPTGSGKSTLSVLLTRLYAPAAGTITWDGLDIQNARRHALRQQVLLVPQESILLGATIYENIRFGRADVTPADVERAARLAHVDEFINDLPSGYDTMVGERGVGLSGGQRQRLALARALVRDPSVLILDEATSALDAITQLAVQHDMTEALRGKTVIKIAHRLETVIDADQIIVMDGGEIVEQGRHADLVTAGGLYARLFEDQGHTIVPDEGMTAPASPPSTNGASPEQATRPARVSS